MEITFKKDKETEKIEQVKEILITLSGDPVFYISEDAFGLYRVSRAGDGDFEKLLRSAGVVVKNTKTTYF